MQKCSSCGADLSENSRFCGKCGSMQDPVATDATATGSNTQLPQSWASEDGTIPATWPPYSNYPTQGSAPAWSPNVQTPGTPPPVAENEDERRRGIPPWSPLYGAALAGDALLGSGQAYTPSAPIVQGTPQIGSIPSVAGSPTPYTNVPVSHPVQAPPHTAPVNHPVQGPQPTHHSPEQPGTQEHHRPHEPHRHHAHSEQHEPHLAARVTKAAGGSAAKTIILVVTAVVVVAGGIGAAAYFLARPQSSISITSNYKVGNAPAGASGTILHISGQKFSSNSAITFLLDGHAAPGNSGTRSDSNGTFSADMTITDAWSVGIHTLTARDTSNDSTKNSVSVTIVQPGQANTPGPTPTPIPPAPTTPPTVFSSGIWKGQGTYNSGQSPFDMTLTTTVNGNSFSGTLTENMYNTTVNIVGTINGDTFSFTDTSYVSGNQITLGTTYTGTVSNGSISGTWVFSNPQDGSGTFSLNLTS
jgi:zinc-ribbon domain